jgi:hypothetical protein
MEASVLLNESTSFIPFKERFHAASAVIALAISSLVVLLNAYAFYLSIKKPFTPIYYFLLNLTAGNIFLGIIDIVMNSGNLASSGWAWPIAYCYFDHIAVMFSIYNVSFSIAAIGYVRCLIMRNQGSFALTQKNAKRWVLAIWIGAIFLSLFPFYTKSESYTIMIQPSLHHCTPNIYSMKPLAIVYKSIIGVIALACIISVIVSYVRIYSIYRYYLKFFKPENVEQGVDTISSPLDGSLPTPSTGSSFGKTFKEIQQEERQQQKDDMKKQEKGLLFQSSMIVTSFTLTWLSLVIIFLISYAGIEMPPWIDLVYDYFITLNCAMDSLVLVVFN